MFDDPRNRLQWMEQALLEEEEEEEYEEERDDLMQRVDELLEEDAEAFSPTVRRGRPAPEFSQGFRPDFDEDAALQPPAKKKGIGGLILLAILETAAIAAIARWWLQWI